MTTTINSHIDEVLRPGDCPKIRRPQTILVGLDGSACGRKAIEVAVRWARCTGAELVGLAVVDRPAICRPEPVSIGGMYWKQERDARRLADAQRRAQGCLTWLADRCAAAGVVSRGRVEVGDPAAVLLRAAQGCDLLVLGQRTHFKFATQDGPDDTLQRVLRSGPCPILVVPEAAAGGSEALVAFDGSPQALHALEACVHLQGGGLASAHVVSIDPDAAKARARAEAAADLWRGPRAAVAEGVPAVGDPTPLILAQGDAPNVGLLVMGVSHRSRLREWFSGSVTSRALAAARVPLLLSN